MTDTTTSPFKRRGFIAAAIVVGIIILAAAIVLISTLTRNGQVPQTSASSSPAIPTTSASTDASVCGLSGSDTENTLSSAPTNKWELVGSVAAPTDPTGAGPGVTDDGFRTCFAHTTEGALFAAVNWVALSTDSRNTAKLYRLLASGAARDKVQAAGGAASSPTDTRLQVAGFKVNSYTATDATIDVAWKVTSEGDALVSVPTVLNWENGDWKIVITDSGAPIAPGPISNLGGYIPWAGV